MLRITQRLKACQCVSTSKALPCRHASSSSTTDSISTNSINALGFTAPLFGKGNKKSWFGSNETGSSNNWIEKSRLPPKNRSIELNLLNQTKQKLDLDQAATNSLIQNYISLRSSQVSFLRILPPRTIERLLQSIRNLNLPLVEKYILEDLQEFKRGKEISLEMLRTDAAEQEQVDLVGVEGDIAASSWKREMPLVELEEESENWSTVITSLDRMTARSILQEYLSSPSDQPPPSISTTFPSVSIGESLQQLWINFSKPLDPELLESNSAHIESDLKLSLALLLKLVISQSEETETFCLPLALEIFKGLVKDGSISGSVLATTPTEIGKDGKDLDREVIFRLVLLRSIIGCAAEERFFDLARTGLSALKELRMTSMQVGSLEEDVDFNLMKTVLVENMGASTLIHHSSYLPTLDRTSDPTLVTFAILHEHLSTFISNSSTPTTLPSSIIPLLLQFSKRATESNRWDLLAALWSNLKLFKNSKEWLEIPNRVKLLRWLGGSGEPWSYRNDLDVVTARSVHSKSYRELATSTFYLLKENPIKYSIELSNETKLKLLISLCDGRGASKVTIDLAIRIYKLFQSIPRVAFVLNASTLLTLVRSSSYEFGGTNNKTFASVLINDFVTSITSTTSPFSSPDRIINNYDLSSLAQCYSIIDDTESISQVYRKMLEQKMVPDLKDLLIILGSSARKDYSLSLKYLKSIDETGIKIKFEMMKVVLINSLAGLKGNQLKLEQAYRVIKGVGKESGLNYIELGELSKIAIKFIKKETSKGMKFAQVYYSQKESRFNEVSPQKLNYSLKTAGTELNSPLLLYLFKRAMKDGILQESSIQLSLKHLLEIYELQRINRETIESTLSFIINHTLSISAITSLPLATKSKTFNLLLESAIKVGKLSLVDRIEQNMMELNIKPNDQVRRSVYSFKVTKLGREFMDNLK